MTPCTSPLLLATDFSAPAGQAADRAARLAAATGHPLVLLHVVNQDWLSSLRDWLTPDSPVAGQLLDAARAQLEQEAQRLRATQPYPVEALVQDGHPVRAVEQVASERQAAWVVIGARGSTALPHLLLGTTAERLLRKTAHPLLVVRQPAQADYQRVLVPVDFSAWSEQAVQLAQRVAPAAHLTLMHTFTVPFEEKLRFAGVEADTIDRYRDQARQQALERLQALGRGSGLPAERYSLCLKEGDAAPWLVQQVQERGCDLVVIGKHGRNAAEELLLGSVTKHVLAEAPCDVMVSTARAA